MNWIQNLSKKRLQICDRSVNIFASRYECKLSSDVVCLPSSRLRHHHFRHHNRLSRRLLDQQHFRTLSCYLWLS